jgi:hypothetical protein
MYLNKHDKRIIRFLLADMLSNYEAGEYKDLHDMKKGTYDLAKKVLGEDHHITRQLKDQVIGD